MSAVGEVIWNAGMLLVAGGGWLGLLALVMHDREQRRRAARPGYVVLPRTGDRS